MVGKLKVGVISSYMFQVFSKKNHPPPQKKNIHTPNILLLNSYPPHPHNHISWLFTCDRHRFRRVLVIHDSQVARNLGHGPSDSSVSKRRRSSNSWSKARTGDCTRPQREENTHELKKKAENIKKVIWFGFSMFFLSFDVCFFSKSVISIYWWLLMMSISLSASWRSVCCWYARSSSDSWNWMQLIRDDLSSRDTSPDSDHWLPKSNNNPSVLEGNLPFRPSIAAKASSNPWPQIQDQAKIETQIIQVSCRVIFHTISLSR